ncbi:MAG: aminoacyl-tRNA hydrolase [Candidatus Taylorbacteria bacterium RIFCSPHIGHO2_01_FULL_44_110]|nr:MAG: aminoacyl-tRNA hydrolase [Candidatus Taylorbacteria bacterium RIFCSPHIGHO2_01_FULL_44_110]OHA45302.1 MAG: aminoacyl-tRNA hydrolase [Candidatus Taylorbacteria bacterium RIFCSPLOWO2_12_FULL_44_9]
MPYIITGLGNPGEEYRNTRHNTGRMILDAIRMKYGVEDFEYIKKINALVAEAKVGKEKITLVAPETFMNNSGKAIGQLVKSVKAAGKLVVIYDDFNLPLGRIRISFNRSSGGHNGLESVIKAVKTEEFLRIRIGVAPETAKGTAKTPHGDEKIEKFILGPYKDDEMKELKKVAKRVVEAVEVIIKDGKDKAMSVYNAG